MPKPRFSPDKLQALLDERGLHITELERQCGFTLPEPRHTEGNGRIRNWMKGRNGPDKLALQHVAAMLGVPVEALYEDEKKTGG